MGVVITCLLCGAVWNTPRGNADCDCEVRLNTSSLARKSPPSPCNTRCPFALWPLSLHLPSQSPPRFAPAPARRGRGCRRRGDRRIAPRDGRALRLGRAARRRRRGRRGRAGQGGRGRARPHLAFRDVRRLARSIRDGRHAAHGRRPLAREPRSRLAARGGRPGPPDRLAHPREWRAELDALPPPLRATARGAPRCAGR
jgi:hypothetical protein